MRGPATTRDIRQQGRALYGDRFDIQERKLKFAAWIGFAVLVCLFSNIVKKKTDLEGSSWKGVYPRASLRSVLLLLFKRGVQSDGPAGRDCQRSSASLDAGRNSSCHLKSMSPDRASSGSVSRSWSFAGWSRQPAGMTHRCRRLWSLVPSGAGSRSIMRCDLKKNDLIDHDLSL